MALGKAYIEVHADTKPFARELGRELDRIVKNADKQVRVGATKMGENVTRSVSKGVKKDSKKLSQEVNKVVQDSLFGNNIFAQFSKSIIDTIDDGISGLPDEIKIILGAALVALTPVLLAVGGALGAALVAGISLGLLGGLGVLVATQIGQVTSRFDDLVTSIQNQFSSAVQWLAGPIISALDLVDARFTKLVPSIAGLAQTAVSIMEPLVDSLFGLVEQALPGIRKGFSGIDRFLLPLQVGLRNIGEAIGRLFNNVLNNPQAPEAFYTIITAVEDLIVLLTDLITIGLAVYGVFRKIGEALGLVEPLSDELNYLAGEYGIATTGAAGFAGAVDTTLNPLTQQEEILTGLNDELETYTNLLFKVEENQIDFEEQTDRLAESIKKNGTTLDTTNEAGRENARILLAMARNALETRKTQIELTGDVKNSQIEFEAQRQKIYEVAKQMHLSEAATKDLIGGLLSIPPPVETGPSQGSINRLNAFYELLEKVRTKLPALIGAGVLAGVANVKAHADGGVFSTPHMGLVAEAGPEAIIPLNRPARAAQILNQSGLSGMMSPSVNVYIGNQQIDAYIDNRVDGAMRAFSRSLSYGSRAV